MAENINDFLPYTSKGQLFESMLCGLFMTNRHGRIVYWNSAAERITGYASKEVLGRDSSFLFEGEGESEGENAVLEICRARTRDGKPRSLATVMIPLGKPCGSVEGSLVYFAEDTSSRLQQGRPRDCPEDAEEEPSPSTAPLEQEYTRLKGVLDAMADPAYICAPDYRILFGNRALEGIFGSREEQRCYRFFHGRSSPCRNCPMARVLAGETVQEESFYKGINRTFEVVHTPFRAPDGEDAKLAVFRDTSDRKKGQMKLWRQANFDTLTGLPNRRLLHDRLQQTIAQADRDRHAFALMFIDLDRFKEINDSLGHAAGDRVLKEASQRMLGCLRKSDTLARFGGDEFVVILQHVKGRQAVSEVAHKMLQSLASPIPVADEQVQLSGSIGISLYPDDGLEGESLLKHADTAMYRVKKRVKNTFCFFSGEN